MDRPDQRPYIGDRALANRVIEILHQKQQAPLYVHIITMENHGPLHLENLDAGEADKVFTGAIPADCRDLLAYTRHLTNADAMFEALRETLVGRARPAALCIFGDHVPIMPDVYKNLGEVDGTTDYVLWRSDVRKAASAMSTNAHSLAAACLAAIGLEMKHSGLSQRKGSVESHESY